MSAVSLCLLDLLCFSCERSAPHIFCSAAYCPNGESSSIYYGRDPFSGEQWAPIKTDDGSKDWVQVGTVDEVATCTTYSSRFGNTAPWESDGSSEEKKQHVLCCQKAIMVTDPETNEKTSMEDVMADNLRPIWYGETHGWNGGSHNDAQLFCSASGKKELCPYVAVSLLTEIQCSVIILCCY